MESPVLASSDRDAVSNILRNLGWLIGGKGFGAVCSLVYLAILARSLGLREFGHFSLIFGIAQALVAIAGFQTWQTLVRYGAKSVHEQDWGRFGRLAWFCGAIDLAGAILGCGLAVVIFRVFQDELGLNPRYVDMALAFNCALMWSRMTTPSGIVRVLDRFDVGTYVEAVVPAGRLIASIAIAATGPTVLKYLVAWAFFDILSAGLYWFFAWRLVPAALHRAHFGHWSRTLHDNPGMGSFFAITFINSTLDALYKQGPLLAVGYILGTSAAGLYRFADQLAQAIGRFSSMIPRAIFPEFATTLAQKPANLRKLVRKVTLVTGGAGLTMVAITLLFGRDVLFVMGGREFAGGAAILLPLAIGASFELAAVSFEPLLLSTGHQRLAVAIRAISIAALGAGILALVRFGAVGVGWAVATGLFLVYLAMILASHRILQSFTRSTAFE